MLNGKAPAGGAAVTLTSSSPAATPPATVTIPAGGASATVSIPTADVVTSTPVVVTASWNGGSVQAPFTVRPAPAPTSLTLTPTTFVGGGPGSVDGLVTVASAATFDQTLRLSSDNPTVLPFLSSAVVIPAGTTRGSFLVLPAAVSTTTVVTISVTGAGVTRSAALTVTPAAAPPPPTPTAPSLLAPANDASPAQPVRFDWSDVTGGARYVLEIDDADTFTAPLVASATVTASEATVGSLPARQLWWRVRAQNSAGTFGPYSAVRRLTPQATTTPPPGTTLAAPSLVSPTADRQYSLGQSITFDWSDVSGAASYTIEIDDDDRFTAPAVLSQTVAASQLTTSALPARRMWWRVRANSAAGVAGPWSAVRRFEVR
jgi:hypothetical protein